MKPRRILSELVPLEAASDGVVEEPPDEADFDAAADLWSAISEFLTGVVEGQASATPSLYVNAMIGIVRGVLAPNLEGPHPREWLAFGWHLMAELQEAKFAECRSIAAVRQLLRAAADRAAEARDRHLRAVERDLGELAQWPARMEYEVERVLGVADRDRRTGRAAEPRGSTDVKRTA